MSLSIALNNAISGLNAGQAGLAVASQNIANANTEGYSKKVSNQSAAVINGVPNGVTIDIVTRLTNDFLNTELKNATSDYQKAAVVDEFFQLMQNFFGSPGSNTSFANDFAGLMGDLESLANTPENAALRFDVVSSGVILADTISKLAKDLQTLRFQADQEINAAVNRINDLTTEIEELNIQIKKISAVGGSTADLEDKRDLAVRRIAEEIDINTFIRADGRMALFTRNGRTLVDDRRHEIEYSPASTVGSATVFSEMRVFGVDVLGKTVGLGEQLVSSGTSGNITNTIRSGRLAGLLQTRGSDLPDLAASLDSLANIIRNQVNAAHNNGTGFPPPNDLTGSRTIAASNSFQATGTVRIAVTDSSGVIVDVQDLDLTALGATTIGQLATNITTALAGNATAAIVDGNLVITATDPNNGIAINPVGTAESVTGRTFSHFFGLNDFFDGTTASDLSVRANIQDDPSRISTGLFSTTAAVSEVGISVGDNRTVQSLAAIADQLFAFSTVGGLPAMTVTIIDFAGSVIGLNSARAANATDVQEQREFVLENIQFRHSSDTGVNIDEELANLVLFQNAFTMSARVLDIASQMFDTLINIQS